MATNATTSAAAKARAAALAKQRAAQAAQARQQQLGMTQPAMLNSPYDGSNPYGIPTGGLTDPTGALTGTGRPQVNATNQSALAPNGDVNQQVTNTNNYYNIVMPGPFGRLFGNLGLGGLSPWGQQPTIDPTTGAYYVQRETGFIGWLKRLVRGY